MDKPVNGRNDRSDVVATRGDRNEFVAKPSLYASIVDIESKLRQVSLSRLEPKPITTRTVTREVNFPLTQEVYDYGNMMNIGLNSGTTAAIKPKPREFRLAKKPEPKLSDYYQPNFDNAQRIQMDCVQTSPELTVQYDGLAVTRLLNEIDSLVFK